MKIASDLDSLIDSWTAEIVGIAPAPTPETPVDDWATARSSDGRYSITRRGGDGVSLHDALTGQDIDLSDHHIQTVAFSPDGSQFATGGADQTVRLWDSSTGVLRRTFPRHASSVQSVAFIQEGKALVSASRDGSLVLWNIDPSKIDLDDELKRLPSRYVPVTSLAVSTDGRWLAVGSGNWMSVDVGHVGHIVVWDLKTLQEHAVFECDRVVGAMGFKTDNNTLAAGDYQGRVTFWNLAEQRRIGTTPPKFKDAVAAARFSLDTQALARVGLDDIVAPPELESPTPSRLYLNRSANRERYTNGLAVDAAVEGVRLAPAASTGLRDLQSRVEALERSIDSDGKSVKGESGTAVRQESNQETNSTGAAALIRTPLSGYQIPAAAPPATR